MVNTFADKELTDISSLNLESIRGKISTEDFQRLEKHKP